MIASCFFDTNILVYAAAGSQDERAKQSRALELIATADAAVSAQVLQEFYVTVTRKARLAIKPALALEWVEQFRAFPCVPIDSNLVILAAEASERFAISYWDGAIVAAAETARAEIVYSEDLNNGQRYGTVRVVNPFSN